ncbi:MAG: hypothetical protein HYS27_12025 [Deltaproteobacteria bacterium]|nr:hypothetical protein [Deltaproteobacteria bacterium]
MRALVVIGALAASTAVAQPAAVARKLVYVDDVVAADQALASDAAALTSALCSALGKDKRLDVLCAPDIRQILGFAATAAMVGSGTGPTGAVMERLDKTQLVVASTLRKDGAGFVLVVKAGTKGADATAEAMYLDKALVAFEQRAGGQRVLFDALPGLAAKVADGLLKPTAATPPAPTPPPAPLGDKPR